MTGGTAAHPTLAGFLKDSPDRLIKGPIAVLLIEDAVAVGPTLAHHLKCGFRLILALSPEPLPAHHTEYGQGLSRHDC